MAYHVQGCGKPASFQCPRCVAMSLPPSTFCSQVQCVGVGATAYQYLSAAPARTQLRSYCRADSIVRCQECFKSAWPVHKLIHIAGARRGRPSHCVVKSLACVYCAKLSLFLFS